MLPDRVSNPGPLTYESDALPIALRGPAGVFRYPMLSFKASVSWFYGRRHFKFLTMAAIFDMCLRLFEYIFVPSTSGYHI